MSESPTLNDGYGDTSADEVIGSKEIVLRLMVTERRHRRSGSQVGVVDVSNYDDVMQEGRIAIWQALPAAREKAANLDHYLHAAARNRITNVVNTNGGWTGHTGKQGKPVDPLRNPANASLDHLLDADPEDQDPADARQLADVIEASSPDVMDTVMLAYHHGELAQALNALPEAHRRYVLLRFWGGMTDGEIADQEGATKKAWESRWSKRIRPALADRLAHLAPV